MFNTIDLFAGAGGFSIGLEQAGFEHILLNEIDKDAVATLKLNRPDWNIVHQDVKELNLEDYNGTIDLITGGTLCQPFSHSGKRLGLEDTRGTLFYEFARIVKEVEPKMFMFENVKGLKTHDNGRTLQTIMDVFEEVGYHIFTPKLLRTVEHNVPQKRERLILIGVNKHFFKGNHFSWPLPSANYYTVRDALEAGDLYDTDVPESKGQTYSSKKIKVMKQVPEGGNWRNLPIEVQKDYMKSTFYSKGGRTGIAKRLSYNEPAPTIVCSPSQKQTERCHPTENRPLTIRESARIQTFPDDWDFIGSISSQYRQIGNAVPVNLGYELGLCVKNYLQELNKEEN